MKNVLILFVLILLSVSCRQKKTEKISYYPNGLTKSIERQISIDSVYKVNFEYYDNGDTLHIMNYLNGKKHGRWIQFYLNNKIESSYEYYNNELNGNYCFYYPSGNIESKGCFKDSILNGTRLVYFDTITHQISRENQFFNIRNKEYLSGYIWYNKDGTIQKRSSMSRIISSKDTFNQNEKATIVISLEAPKYDSTFFFIGEYADKFYLKESNRVDTIHTKNHRIEYILNTTIKGVQFVRGGIKNQEIRPDGWRVVSPEYYFEYQYYVK